MHHKRCDAAQTLKIDEDCLTQALSLNHGTAPITREQLFAMVMRREIHPVRVTYELILDHKNAKIRIDGAQVALIA